MRAISWRNSALEFMVCASSCFATSSHTCNLLLFHLKTVKDVTYGNNGPRSADAPASAVHRRSGGGVGGNERNPGVCHSTALSLAGSGTPVFVPLGPLDPRHLRGFILSTSTAIVSAFHLSSRPRIQRLGAAARVATAFHCRLSQGGISIPRFITDAAATPNVPT